MKNKFTNILILFLAISLVLFFALKDDFNNIMDNLTSVNIAIFLLSILVLLISLLFKAASLRVFLRESDKTYSLKKSFLLTMIAQFLNGITPFQTGGQPFQIYLLKKDGIRIADSTNAMIKDFIAYQTALITMGVFALIVSMNTDKLFNNRYLNILLIGGFIINLIVLLMLLYVSLARKSGKKLINKIIFLCEKIKFLRKKINKDKIDGSIDQFYSVGKQLSKNKTSLFLGIGFHLIHLILLYSIPLIIFNSIGVSSVTMIQVIVITSFIMLIGNFIPVPGATGGIEYSFLVLFGIFVTGPALTSAMLLWRGVTYLFGMLVGGTCLLLKKGNDRK